VPLIRVEAAECVDGNTKVTLRQEEFSRDNPKKQPLRWRVPVIASTLGGTEARTLVTDGTGALAWGFDPAEKPLAIDDLDRTEASKLLAAGYAVRRVLGVHPLDDVEQPDNEEPAAFDASEFEAREQARRRRRRNAA